MKFTDVIEQRHSVRWFKSDPVSEEDIRKIVDVACKSASWCNNQPWNVYIATGETTERIRKAWVERGQKGVKGHRTEYSERSQKNMEVFTKEIGDIFGEEQMAGFAKYFINLFNAPVLVYLTIKKDHVEWATYDLGGFGNILMLAAKDLGIDSLPAYALVQYPDIVRKEMDIPDNEDVAMGICLGYEADDKINKYRAKKLTVNDVLVLKK